MLAIRLLRVGKKHQPSFRVVVTEKSSSPRGGRFIEKLGFVNPLTKENSLNKERIQYWLSQGAKCSDTVYNLLIKEKIIEGKKIDVHKEGKKKEGEAPKEVKPAEGEAPKAEESAKEEPKTEEVKEEKPVEEKKEEAKPEKPEEKKEEKPDETKEEPKESSEEEKKEEPEEPK